MTPSLQLPGLGQLLQGAASARAPRDPVRARRASTWSTARTGPSCSAARTPRCACRPSSSTTAGCSPSRTRSCGTSPTARRTCPTDTFERAQVLQWLFFEQYEHEPYIAVAASGLPTSARRRARRRSPIEQAGGYRRARRDGGPSRRRDVPRRRALLDRRHRPLRLHPRRGRGRFRSRPVPGRSAPGSSGSRAQPGHVPITPEEVARCSFSYASLARPPRGRDRGHDRARRRARLPRRLHGRRDLPQGRLADRRRRRDADEPDPAAPRASPT